MHTTRWLSLFLLAFVIGVKAQEPPPPLTVCPQAMIDESLAILGDYTPSQIETRVTLRDGAFHAGDAVFDVRGVNYYPAQYPWRRFLTETGLDTVRADLTLLREAGFNTLRIFLWNEALFNCRGSGAVPNWGVFQRLDGIIRNAGNMGFRLIVTLNDLPDLEHYPLYDNPFFTQLQTVFIVERYRDEAAIFAWDLRNEGDIDYGSKQGFMFADFSREQVLDWLDATAQMVRRIAPEHLITAGWLHDAGSTAPAVDFVSFHHWDDTDGLRQRIADIRAVTDKPILLQEFGYSTFYVDWDQQATLIGQIIDTAEAEGLLGWMLWAAFDFPIDRSCFPSPCESPNNAEHYFGIWTADATPKPAAEQVSAWILAND